MRRLSDHQASTLERVAGMGNDGLLVDRYLGRPVADLRRLELVEVVDLPRGRTARVLAAGLAWLDERAAARAAAAEVPEASPPAPPAQRSLFDD